MLRMSGLAVTRTDVANVEGPVSAGVSVWLTVHADTPSANAIPKILDECIFIGYFPKLIVIDPVVFSSLPT